MKNLIFVIAPALLPSEGMLRVFDSLGASYLFEIHRYSRTVKSDPRFAYLQPPRVYTRRPPPAAGAVASPAGIAR